MAEPVRSRALRIVGRLIVTVLTVGFLLAAHDLAADRFKWACRYLANGVWVETTGTPRCLESVFP